MNEKSSCPVLRGRDGGNTTLLLDHLTSMRRWASPFLKPLEDQVARAGPPPQGVPPARRRSHFFLPRLKPVGIQNGGFHEGEIL